jgi:FKBP-type peptidyl-prolyl cis-trans isomerase
VRHALRIGTLACVLALAAGCRQLSLQAKPVDVHSEEVSTESGVRYEDRVLGEGEPAAHGDQVQIDYTVWLESGERVDSTLDRGVPITVKIGEAPIKGLDEGLVGMRCKGHRRLVIPSELAYGKEGVEGLFPPDANLVFEVTLVKLMPQVR